MIVIGAILIGLLLAIVASYFVVKWRLKREEKRILDKFNKGIEVDGDKFLQNSNNQKEVAHERKDSDSGKSRGYYLERLGGIKEPELTTESSPAGIGSSSRDEGRGDVQTEPTPEVRPNKRRTVKLD